MSYIHKHTKEDGRSLWLYSQKERGYTFTNDLPPLDNPATPFRRWHALREEYVFYNASRNNRTLNPPAEYNPLAPVQVDGFPGEIPVTDFEIAVFDNRWPGLSLKQLDKTGDFDQEPSTGKCEVVVYSTRDNGSLGDFSVEHIALLLEVWGSRHAELISSEQISYVMPFENRGEGVGVSLPHPHGQIYAFETTPAVIQKQCKANEKSNFFANLLKAPTERLVVAENGEAIVYCAEFGRYPFESWLLPKISVASPLDMSSNVRLSYAKQLKDHVNRLDKLFGEAMDYVMWVSFPPKGFEGSWPFHIQFWPMKRGAGKMKYLASVEQITQLFLCDILPEDAAETLRNVKI